MDPSEHSLYFVKSNASKFTNTHNINTSSIGMAIVFDLNERRTILEHFKIPLLPFRKN